MLKRLPIMLKPLSIAAVLGVFLSACASGPPPEPPPPPPLDPTGTYDVLVDSDGMEITGTMTIRGSAETGYTGSVITDMGAASLTDVTVDGQTVTCYVPDVGADVRMVFEGDSFTGRVTGGMIGEIWGSRRSGG